MTSKWHPPAQKETAPAPADAAGSKESEQGPKTEPAMVTEGQPTYRLESTEVGSKDGYARILVDVPMTLGSRGGATIGFLRKGTRVKVLAQSEADTVSVAAPFPAVNRYGGLRTVGETSGVESPLFVTIEAKTSASPSQKNQAPKGTDTVESVRYGLYRELSPSPGGPGFAFVKCGKVRIIERKGSRLRVAAEYDSGELYGWLELPKGDERDSGCDWGKSPQLPQGYLRVQADAEAKLANLVQSKAELYWAARKGDSSRCERWVFAPGKDLSTGWLYQQDDGVPVGSATRTERSYGVSRNVLSLGGLVYRQNDAAVVAGGKVDFYAVVRADNDSLDVMEWEPSSNAQELSLVGYRASTAKTWYLSRAACESGAVKPASVRSKRDSSGRPEP
jgi:hypothetical protein